MGFDLNIESPFKMGSPLSFVLRLMGLNIANPLFKGLGLVLGSRLNGYKYG